MKTHVFIIIIIIIIVIVFQTAEHLATLVINLCRVIDPEVIIFGGGLSKAGEVLIELIRKHVQRKTWTVLPTDVILRIAQLHEPGLLGTALAAKQKFGSRESLSPVSATVQNTPVIAEVATRQLDHPTVSTTSSSSSTTTTPSTCNHHLWLGAFLSISSVAQYYISSKLTTMTTATATTEKENSLWRWINTSLLVSQIGVGVFLLSHSSSPNGCSKGSCPKK